MTHQHKQENRFAWFTALILTTILYLFIIIKIDIHFLLHDDTFILRYLMGYETGTPAAFHPLLQNWIVWPIYLLHLLFPLVPWYSYVQLALLFISLCVIAKSIILCFLHCRKPLWAGVSFATVFLMAFGMEYVARMTFTCTAGMLGAAAVSQFLSIDFRRASFRQITCSLLFSVFLLILCESMRTQSGLPSSVFLLIAGLYTFGHCLVLGKKNDRQSKIALLTLVLFSVLFGTQNLLRQIDISTSASPEYLEWSEERTELMDFWGVENISPDLMEELNWNETTLRLVQDWFFLDGDITTDAFRTINDFWEQQDTRTIGQRLQNAKRIVRSRIIKSSYAFELMAVALIAGGAGAIGALFQKGNRIRLLLTLASIVGAFGLMLIYLAFRGRLPLRAINVTAMPAVAMMLCMLPACLPDSKPFRIFLPIVTFIIILYTLINVTPLYRLMQRHPWTKQHGQVYANLEAYAVEHPDHLFIADKALTSDDLNPFPSYPDGLPLNISYWGEWHMRSPSSEAMFDRFGLDVWNFDPEAFLRGDVFFATNQVDTPPTLLLDWLQAETGKEINWKIYAQEGKAFILQFYEN